MSLTVKHLNADASFLLTFSPDINSHYHYGEKGLPSPSSLSPPPNSFTILVDPWLTGPSKIWHSKFSISTHIVPSCVSSLTELPEPDLVIISQNKTDHCHRETLTQLSPRSSKTTILAEAGAARTIRSWKHFDDSKIKTLKKFERNTNKSCTLNNGKRRRENLTLHRIPIPALTPHGEDGEVTIAYIAQKYDATKLHSAIGITYLSPTYHNPLHFLPATPPDSPRSISTIHSPGTELPLNPVDSSLKPISILYSPHGITYPSLIPYIKTHLPLPLTLLLHCFDRISNPWYLGGTICSGLSTGATIALNLKAETWISAHDGDKLTKGFATIKTTSEKFAKEDVEEIVSPRSEKFCLEKGGEEEEGTRAVVLGVGEECVLGRGRVHMKGLPF